MLALMLRGGILLFFDLQYIIDIWICGKDCDYTLWSKRAWPFIWTNLNPRHSRMLYAKCDWNWPNGSGADFKISSMNFRYFVSISSLNGAWPALNLNKFQSPSSKNALCQLCLMGPGNSIKEDKNVKSVQTDGRTTGDLSFQLRWAKNQALDSSLLYCKWWANIHKKRRIIFGLEAKSILFTMGTLFKMLHIIFLENYFVYMLNMAADQSNHLHPSCFLNVGL